MRYGLHLNPVPRMDVGPGDRVRLDGDDNWWTVQAVSPHYAALVRPPTAADLYDPQDVDGDMEDIDPTGPLYTVLDWRSGVRGPCDLIGQGWGDGTYTPEQCAALLARFEADGVHVSQRNWVRLHVIEHRPADVPTNGTERQQ